MTERTKQMIVIGRECVRILDGTETEPAFSGFPNPIVLIGRQPKGFPRGQHLGDHTDGAPIRMYDSVKVLKFCQGYIARNMDTARLLAGDKIKEAGL